MGSKKTVLHREYGGLTMERGAETPNQKKMMATIEAAKTRDSQRERGSEG